jgi:hypothetical protein
MITVDKAKFERNIKIALLFGNEDPDFRAEVEKLIKRVRNLNHEYRDGRLYVGSSANSLKWHEVRQSVNDTVYCKRPTYGFRRRPGKGDGLCKHIIYVIGHELEIPNTADLKTRAGK